MSNHNDYLYTDPYETKLKQPGLSDKQYPKK